MERRQLTYSFLALGLVGSVCVLIFVPIVRIGQFQFSAYCIGVVCLIVAGWAVHARRFWMAAVGMLIGGICTSPFGFPILVIAVRMIWDRIFARQAKICERTKLCMKCGYDLRGTDIPRCPECGCLRGFDKTPEELGIEKRELWWER